MTEYVRLSAVYRELRTALGPWCKENGYRRQRDTDASWIRALEFQGEKIRRNSDYWDAASVMRQVGLLPSQF